MVFGKAKPDRLNRKKVVVVYTFLNAFQTQKAAIALV